MTYYRPGVCVAMQLMSPVCHCSASECRADSVHGATVFQLVVTPLFRGNQSSALSRDKPLITQNARSLLNDRQLLYAFTALCSVFCHFLFVNGTL